MRQGRQVSGGPHRPLLGDAGIDAGIEQSDQRLDHLEPDAGIATGQAVYLEEQQQADGRLRHQRPGPGGVGKDDGPLQMLQLVPRDAGPRQEAEAGVDPVDGPPLPYQLRDGLHRALDGVQASRRELELHRFRLDSAQLRQG